MKASQELEKVFQKSSKRLSSDEKVGFTKEEFCVMDFEKKEMKFKNPIDMANWIWGPHT